MDEEALNEAWEAAGLGEACQESEDAMLAAAEQIDRDNAVVIKHIGTLFDHYRRQERLAERLRSGRHVSQRSQLSSAQ